MSKSKNKLMTILIILGILLTYIHQMSPSPILSAIGEDYSIIGNDALLNMSISIIFLMMVVGSIAGGALEAKLGTSRLFVLTLVLVTIGLAINFLAVNYTIFLVGRVVYGLGFGLGVPFIGSAIMKWYPEEKRDLMTTINALFPFFGTVICFIVMEPQYNLFNRNIQLTFGVWGVISLVIILLWILLIRDPGKHLSFDDTAIADDTEEKPKENVYLNLIKRKPIRLLAIIFICDFACYSYIATILPTFLFEMGNMSETTANLWAAVAFPTAGIVGCGLGGIITNRLARKKTTLILV